MPNHEAMWREWIGKAEEDERSINAILKDEAGAPSTACFLSQQMAEKYLKAFLLARRGEFPKVHHVDLLLKLCLEFDSEFNTVADNALQLTDYYTDARYPMADSAFTFAEARQALASAVRIKELALKKLNIVG